MHLDDGEYEKLIGLRKLPKFRAHDWIFILAVTPTTGLAKVAPSKHVDLWMFKSFNPVTATTKVIAL